MPPWEELSAQWTTINPPTTSTVTLGPCELILGHNDTESDDLLPQHEADALEHEFGWDNESPKRLVHVGQFKVEWRPISNGEFLEFWRGSAGKVPMPTSWIENAGEVQVRYLVICLSSTRRSHSLPIKGPNIVWSCVYELCERLAMLGRL